MHSSHLIRSAGLTAAITFLASGAALAGSISGTIDSSITLVEACSIDGAENATGVDFGSLEFGSPSALFTQADAQVVDSGGSGVTVLCSPGVNATFTLKSGLHDSKGNQGVHAMKIADPGTAYVGYSLYSDAARTAQLALNGTIDVGPFVDQPISLDLYGRAFGDPGKLPAGTYNDTLNVELTW